LHFTFEFAMNIKRSLIRLHQLSLQFGIDPRRLAYALGAIPAFINDYRRFRRTYRGPITFNPQLHDRYAEGGVTKSEYFWQDLIVARWIHEANPMRHVDVGSRTDGFVAHVASFREMEVFDVRPITTEIPGVTFRQVDLMDTAAMSAWQDLNSGEGGAGYCDSLSCLHVLEHFGLGRYGDPIDPNGYKAGFANLASLLLPGSRFYLSTPIGQERVEFNANWVFDPATILKMADSQGLRLERFCVFNPRTGLREIEVAEQPGAMVALAAELYNLGIFVFTRPLDKARQP